jgi:DNA replication protein DnaC
MSMMHQQTIEKLREMKLHGLAAAWQEQQARADVAGLDFDERFGLLIDAEWMTRINARLQRNLKEAHLKFSGACLEDLDHDDRRHIDKNLIRQLATCQWVTAHQNIAITGMTGTGKTFLACALAQHALRRRYRAIYRRTSRLFDELALARADGTYARLLARLAAASLRLAGLVRPPHPNHLGDRVELVALGLHLHHEAGALDCLVRPACPNTVATVGEQRGLGQETAEHPEPQ